ncbi:hypothetical protein [Nocardioides sp. CF8]|uniref:hypothetical protein n=1 Tax=Nocardioides sp. CF8 TaxID=110319 RepID=UPI000688B8A7|nr:hypothetical protein [Nocardioides sp. CF8]
MRHLPWTWGNLGASLAPTAPPTYDGPHLVRSVSVEAAPEVVFRWLLQMQLAPYSYDLLDNWGRRSPRHLVEGLDVRVGTAMMDIFTVTAIVPDRVLELTLTDPGPVRAFGPLVCTYQAVPRVGGTTLRCDIFLTPRHGLGRVRAFLLAWGDLVMMRKQLLTFRRLSEQTAQPVQVPSSQAVPRTER